MKPLKEMNNAMNYIENHLTEEIDYQEVANIARSSEHQFKRIFSFLAGVPLSEYIRLRRLSLAASDITQSSMKIIDIALKYGYQSPDAFTKAFVLFHGVTPSEARRKPYSLKVYPKVSFQLSIRGGKEMKYQIVEKNSFTIVGVKQIVEVHEGEINPSYDKIMENVGDEPFEELDSLSEEKPYGILHVTTPNHHENSGDSETLDHYIGTISSQNPENKYDVLEVPASQWAVFDIRGEWPKVEKEWQRIYSEWLPSSNYELVEAPEILASNNEVIQIWIPIKK